MVIMSHKRVVLSALPEARMVSSGLKATDALRMGYDKPSFQTSKNAARFAAYHVE
jgi:hypothetical protein